MLHKQFILRYLLQKYLLIKQGKLKWTRNTVHLEPI